MQTVVYVIWTTGSTFHLYIPSYTCIILALSPGLCVGEGPGICCLRMYQSDHENMHGNPENPVKYLYIIIMCQ